MVVMLRSVLLGPLNPIEDQEFVHYTIDFRRDPCAAQLLQRDVELFDGTAGQGGEEDHFAEEQQGMRNCQRGRERGSTMKEMVMMMMMIILI
jgi:hypothetical protein